MNALRAIHRDGNRLTIFPCNKCSYGVDFEKRWKNVDWANWDPYELLPKDNPDFEN